MTEIQDYLRQVEAIKKDADELVSGVSKSQFNWRPDPSQWSMAQCLEHLNMTARLYLPPVYEKIVEARSTTGLTNKGPFRFSLLSKWIVSSMDASPKYKFKAPKKILPPADRPMDEVVSGFLLFQDRLGDLIKLADGTDLARIKVQSPLMKFLKLPLGQILALILAHERRHIQQAHFIKKNF